MYQSVSDAFTDFTKQYEGAVAWMYLDVEDYVTVGVGNKIDPIDQALAVKDQFVQKADGNAPADPDTAVTNDWHSVKGYAGQGKNWQFFGGVTQLQMANPYALVMSHATSDEGFLTSRFANWGNFPADAQLAALSMSYAMGPGFNFPAFLAAVNAVDGNGNWAPDWKTAAAQSHMSEAGNPGVAPRNVADRVLLLNAQYMKDQGLANEPLQYSVAGAGGIDLRVIQSGSTDTPGSPLVTWLQNRLNALGYLDLTNVTLGTFDGPNTTQDTTLAVQQLQKDWQLNQDGIVGKNTYAVAGTCIPQGSVGNYTN